MNKAYTRINWENEPSDATPLNETNLNRMDAAINEIDTRVVTMDTTKLSVATANSMVKDIAFDETTGVFTITKLNGSVVTINTALEKIATNFVYDKTTQKLILTLIDGTTQEVDLTALLTQYEFLDSDTIAFTISSDGKVTASVKNGSITGDKLEPNYLADVTLQANNAKDSADNAKTSEELAHQYAEEAKESASQTAKNDAANITYDNATSGLTSNNVQGAIDELKDNLENFNITVDDTLSTTSTNPVQNKVVTESLNDKAKKDGSNASGTWGIDISGNAATATSATKATQDANGKVITDTYAKKSSVLSTLTECEASTTDTDIAGASALAEMSDSFKTPTYNVITLDAYNMRVRYRKILNIAELDIESTNYNLPVNADITLCTLPEGYRPKDRSFPFPEGYNLQTTNSAHFYLGKNGSLILQNYGTAEARNPAGHCTYFV